VKQVTDFRYVRFHGIFLDEVGVYDEDAQGRPVYNFSYVDQIYDGLLRNGVRPFVEISFMPYKLASKNSLQAFWYKPNVAPPKDWAKWDDLITAFAKHLVDRYGENEVAQWYFEVWNEPNIDFWAGEPKQATYFELYDHTARALKGVSTKLRVGGPAAAQAAWADDFLRHCAENRVPVDFVSSHVYGDDTAKDVFGTNESIPRSDMVCRGVRKVHDQIRASAFPNLPLIWSEFNASYMTMPEITDSTYMGPWLANTIRECDGNVTLMSYWTFSDVFEEQGVVKQPFYGGYGLLAERGIPKPAYGAFELLHQLGSKRLDVNSDSALLTRRDDGTLELAVWNLTPPDQEGSPETVTIQFKNLNGTHQALISRVDRDHGDVRPAYAKMGSPNYPTAVQIEALKEAAKLPAPETQNIQDGSLQLTLPGQGLAVIEVK
jgi:xylan 1,4-beta-xylosidase